MMAPRSTLAPPTRTVRRTSDSTARNSSNTGNTLTLDDQLLFPIGANEVWHFHALLFFNAANTTMDEEVGWDIPSGASMLWQDNIGGGLISVSTATTPAAAGTGVSAYAHGSLAGTNCLVSEGIVANGSTAGSVTLKWSQFTSDAGDLKLMTNSVIIATRIG